MDDPGDEFLRHRYYTDAPFHAYVDAFHNDGTAENGWRPTIDGVRRAAAELERSPWLLERALRR